MATGIGYRMGQGSTKVSTYVFVDLETTDLLRDDNNCRITELCMIAVNRVDFEQVPQSKVPRVINKLTLCFNPEDTVSEKAAELSGLSNDNLKHQMKFKENTVALLTAFLGHLKKPICLLAHNGKRFDFRVILGELKRLYESLHNSLLCCDTLEAFRALNDSSRMHTPIKYQPSKRKSSTSAEDIGELKKHRKVETSSGVDEERKDRKKQTLPSLKKVKTSQDASKERNVCKDNKPPTLKKYKTSSDVDEKTKVEFCSTSVHSSRSSLLDTLLTRQADSNFIKKPYALENIYFRRFGSKPCNSHSAEGDSLALLQIARTTYGFSEWVDQNAVLLSSSRPSI